MGREEEARYRRALREIVEIGGKPDTATAWTTMGKDRAFDRMLRVAMDALGESGE